MHFSRCLSLFLILGITPGVLAQTSAQTTASVTDDFIQKQFGLTCSSIAGPPTYTADLDRDGIEDAVIVAKCTNPLMDETENNFKVLDPYNSFFGYGDTKATSQFASADPLARSRVLLIQLSKALHTSAAYVTNDAVASSVLQLCFAVYLFIMLRRAYVASKWYCAVTASAIAWSFFHIVWVYRFFLFKLTLSIV